MKQVTAFKIEIERIKFSADKTPGKLAQIAKNISQSNCGNDLELILSVALLQRSLKQRADFEASLRLFPQAQNCIGHLILAKFTDECLTVETIETLSLFEAELAAQAVWHSESENFNYQAFLDKLVSIEKFQSPLILYVSAVKSARAFPAQAVNLLIRASKSQQHKRSDILEPEPRTIAKQAVQLAYNLFAADHNDNCVITLNAFENYSRIACEEMDPELQYLYTVVLAQCGQTKKSKMLLQKIANTPASKWRNHARLDLISNTIEFYSDITQAQKNKLLEQLEELIADCKAEDKKDFQVKRQAIAIYCHLLLETADEKSAQNVLDTLALMETAKTAELNMLKAKALQYLQRLDESSECMLKAIKLDNCQYSLEAMELLAKIIDRIDQRQAQMPDFKSHANDYRQLAEFCYSCLQGQLKSQAGLYLAELEILMSDEENDRLKTVEELLKDIPQNYDPDNLDLLRCKARLLIRQSKFTEAVRLWANICEIRNSECRSKQKHSWEWFRAKFYELYCLSRCGQSPKGRIIHTIEVFENSGTEIPHLWTEKFAQLKQSCRH